MKKIIGSIIMIFGLFGQMTETKYIEYLENIYAEYDINNIKPEQLSQNYILLDTREQNEFDVSHIKGAILISYEAFDEQMISNYAKNDTIVLYCSVGKRSSIIAEKLVDMGYENVFNLYGGLFYWANKGRQVVDKEGMATKRVHGYNKYWSKYLYNNSIIKIY